MDSSSPKKFNVWFLTTILLAGVIIGYSGSRLPYFRDAQTAVVNPSDEQNDEEAQTPPSQPSLTAEQASALVEDHDPVYGDADAPITMIEFSDFQCPYCSRYTQLIFPKIDENYVKTGKVKVVYRDFPLDFHQQSQLASEAAECANEQGKYKEMHDLIFQNQTAWSGSAQATELMKDYAEGLDLDMTKFNSCLSTNKFAEEIRKDLVDGATAGVSGTPSFFINGKLISGAMPFETVFRPIFEAELAGKTWELQFDANGQPSVKVN